MDVTELRIGNWVDVRSTDRIKFLKESRYIEVDTIGYNGINISSSYEGSWECDYEEESLFGIPLTPEILEKCGFVKKKDEWFLYPCFEVQIIVYNDGAYNGIMFYTRTAHTDYVPIYATKNMNCLHQVQNFYHALTGKELTINL